MTRLAFKTLVGDWTADGVTYVDEVEVDDASDELVKLAAGAHAAGAIEVLEGLDESHVQSQEAGEAAQAAAQASGEWQVGNELQFRLEAAQARLRGAVEALAADPGDESLKAEHASAVEERDQVEADLSAVKEGQ